MYTTVLVSMSPDVVPVASISVNTHETDVLGIFPYCFSNFPVIVVLAISVLLLFPYFLCSYINVVS